jgi:hypothetical protein
MITVLPTLMINVAAAIIPPLEILQPLLFPLQSALLASLYLEQFEAGGPDSSLPPPPADSPPPPLEESEEAAARRGLD